MKITVNTGQFPFKRHCQTCSESFRETQASIRFCSTRCEADFEVSTRKCPNCGAGVAGTSRKLFCDRGCKRAYGKRMRYPVRGAYQNPSTVEKHRENRRVGCAENPTMWLHRILVEKRKTSSKKGIRFDCTFSDFILSTHCPILGVELTYPPARYEDNIDTYPSIDRIIPALGYISGNVRIISRRANMLKSAASAEESILLALDALRFLPADHPWHQQPPWE